MRDTTWATWLTGNRAGEGEGHYLGHLVHRHQYHAPCIGDKKISGPKTHHSELLETNSSHMSWQQTRSQGSMRAGVGEGPCPATRQMLLSEAQLTHKAKGSSLSPFEVLYLVSSGPLALYLRAYPFQATHEGEVEEKGEGEHLCNHHGPIIPRLPSMLTNGSHVTTCYRSKHLQTSSSAPPYIS